MRAHLLCLEALLERAFGCSRDDFLQLVVVFSHKMSSNFVVQDLMLRVRTRMKLKRKDDTGTRRFDPPLAIRTAKQESAAGKHSGRYDASVPGNADQMAAAHLSEVGGDAPVDFIGGKKRPVAEQLPLRPAAELNEHPTKHMKRCVCVFIVAGKGGKSESTG
jgi:hypothetical protein